MNKKQTITILCVGGQLEMQAYIDLGRGLVKEGYTVRITAQMEFQSFIEAQGLIYLPFNGDLNALAKNKSIKSSSDDAPIENTLKTVKEKISPFVDQAISDFKNACSDTDVILTTAILLHLAHYLSVHYTVPLILCTLQPAGTTKHFPHILSKSVPGPSIVQHAYNLSSHKLITEVIWRLIRDELAKAWSNHFPPKKLPQLDPLAKAFKQKPPLMLYGWSPTILPKPSDWTAAQHITGFWWQPYPTSLDIPSDLQEFVKNGAPPIFIQLDANDQKLNTVIIPVLKELNERAVIHTINDDFNHLLEDDNFYLSEEIPYKWLLTKAKAILHTGRPDLIAHSLYAQCPQLMITGAASQKFWASRLYNLHATPKSIHKKELNQKQFKQQLDSLFNDVKMTKKMNELSEIAQKEQGVETSIELINNFIAPKFN